MQSAVSELMATAGGLHHFIQRRLIHLFEATMRSKEDWTPTTGEQLLLRREPGYPKDHSCSFSHGNCRPCAFQHIQHGITVVVFRRACNTGFAEVAGRYVNQGAGVTALKFHASTSLWSRVIHLKSLQEVFKSLQDKGLLHDYSLADCHIIMDLAKAGKRGNPAPF